MDDLEALGTLLAKPGPSGELVDRGRRRLQQATCEPVRRRPSRRLAGGVALGLAAAVGAVIVVVVPGSKPPGTKPVPGAKPVVSTAADHRSGRQILLAAATSAEAKPAGSGTYWHVKTVYTVAGRPRPTSMETWTRRDGRRWLAWGGPGTVIEMQGTSTFVLADAPVSLARIQSLPTTPAALKARVAYAARHGVDGRVPADALGGFVLDSLISLLAELPAPPKVRAAAFRAIALSPGVRRLGAVKGGQGLLFSASGTETRLTVDPATSLVHDVTKTSAPGGKVEKRVTDSFVTAEWTNRLPTVIPGPRR
jgi:hypothetical protein